MQAPAQLLNVIILQFMADRVAIIAGLGNPGKKYSTNRHNVGFMVLDALADHLNLTIDSRKWEALSGKTRVNNNKGEPFDLVLLKPQTFMNLSGKAVCSASRFFKIPAERLLVIHDEIELSFDDVRMKKGGGHKGQNGLRDIIQRCGSPDFFRLRMGVGRPEHPDVAGHVLSDFVNDEQQQLSGMLEKGCRECLEWIEGI